MAMRLRWLDRTTLPVEADGLAPKLLALLGPSDLARFVVPAGNGQAELGDLFAVTQDDAAADDLLVFEGDLSHLRGLGRGLDRGSIEVRGDAGPGVGVGMSGGSIEVHGNVGDGAGAEMSGGVLRVRGDAGNDLGSARPGSPRGVRGGVILVDGSAGHDVGRRMRRGLIAVGGDAGDGLGVDLIAGTVLACGRVGRYPGLGTKRGTIAVFADEPPEVPATFVPTGRYRFPFLNVYVRQLAAWGFRVPSWVTSAELSRYNGDRSVGGQGEMLVRFAPNA